MKHTQPDYYSTFCCLGKDCPLTCCAGWTISIDEDSLAFYDTLPGAAGREVRNAVDWEEACFLTNDGRCRLLTEEGLCSLQIAAGEEALCDTCRLYPRHTEEFKGCREHSLNLSCPAAAMLILFDKKELPALVEAEDDEEEEIEFDEFDEEAFQNLLSMRAEIFQDMAMGNWHPRSRKAADLQPEELMSFSEKSLPVLEALEVIDSGWPACRAGMIRSLRELFAEEDAAKIISEYQMEWGSAPMRRLYAYFVYVYLAGAVYDDDMEGKLFFAEFCMKWVDLLWLAERHARKGPLSRETMAVLSSRLAREAEHDEDNFYRITDAMQEGQFL